MQGVGTKQIQPQGGNRRLKAAIVVLSVYGCVTGLHLFTYLVSWGQWLVLGLVCPVALHALRLLSVGKGELPPPNKDGTLPRVSLLVAAKNEETVIGSLAEALCQLAYDQDRLEIWIIDDNSSDRTPEILADVQKNYPQLQVLRRGAEATGGKSGALNQVLPLTQGEIIGVFDADAHIDSNFLYALVPLFQNPYIGAVQLRKAIANGAENFWTKGQVAEMALDGFFQERRQRIGGIAELRGNGQFVRREALEICGGWNEQTITDDLDLTFRLHLYQWQIAYLGFPCVHEEGVVTWKQLWHQRNRWAEGGFQRYLDYWQAIVKELPLHKQIDLWLFFLMQYLLPTALVPDLCASVLLRHGSVVLPFSGMAVILSSIGMAFGVRKAYQLSWWAVLWQTLRGTLYMLHWIPVMISVTLRMAIRPKRLKWVKTVHQGVCSSNL
ncbi:MAG: glycosyltransferase [Pseudanabaenaceae cyanobacterium]